MFSTRKHRLRRSSRPPKPLRYYYHASSHPNNPYTYHPNKQYLTTLPPELQLSIFESLDPVSSTCLGLTSRKLYPMHRAAHKNVGLYDTAPGYTSHSRHRGREEERGGLPLCMLLKNWVPENLVLDWESEKLVSRERHAVLEEVRRREVRPYWEGHPVYKTHRRDEGHYRSYDYEPYREEERTPRKLRRSRKFERRGHRFWRY
jgi:hypothetical protein